jgi:hypothetical protein
MRYLWQSQDMEPSSHRRWPPVQDFEAGSFRGPNKTRLLTKSAPAGRESESFGQWWGQKCGRRRSRPVGSELSPRGLRQKPLPNGRENDERRELSLSASCVNQRVGGNSASQTSSPCRTRTNDPRVNRRGAKHGEMMAVPFLCGKRMSAQSRKCT